MSTKIEWCDETWNPVTGCREISEGCAHCYAKRQAQRFKGRFGYDKDDPFKVTFHPDKLYRPLKWKKPKRIFVCSMGDLFHEDVLFRWVDEILGKIQKSPQHTFMILTKRPDRMESHFQHYCFPDWDAQRIPNLWLGISAENQRCLDERLPYLLQIPAAKRFVSLEPLLGPIKFRSQHLGGLFSCVKLDWVIVGGETGYGKRPMDPDWVRSIRDQCQEAGTPFFFKGWGNKNRSLFGREWNEFPKGGGESE